MGRGWSATGRRGQSRSDAGKPAAPSPGGGSDPATRRSQATGRGWGGRGERRDPPPETRGPDLHFISAFTDTIDLSALRRRLELEDARVPDQTEYIPRLYGRNRGDGDAASTQVVRRSGVPGNTPVPRSRAGAGAPAGASDPDRLSDSRRGRFDRADDPDLVGAAATPSGAERPGARAAEEKRTGGGSTKTKAIWTLADQGVSSATNAAVSILVAHFVGKTEYAAGFAVPYLIFSVIIGISRSSCCVPLGIAYAGRSAAAFRHAAGSTTGACLAFGAVLSLPTVLVGFVLGGRVGSGLVIMGFVLPGLLLQDAWRYVFFAQGVPVKAFVNDVAWALVQVVGLSVLIRRGVEQSPPMLLAWGVAALVAALLGVAQAGLWPAPSRALAWFRENRANAANLTAEFITVQGALQASILLMGGLRSAEIVGDLSAVRTILGPTTVIGVGIVSFAVPELSRRMDMSARARQQAAVVLTSVVVGLGLLWSSIFILFPALGEYLFGKSWPGAHAILLISALHYAGTALPTGPACIMYALGHTRKTFRINLVMAPMLFAFPIIGLLLGDARGAVIGFNIVFWGIAPVWWIQLRRVIRDHEAERLAAVAARQSPAAEAGGGTAGRGVTLPGVGEGGPLDLPDAAARGASTGRHAPSSSSATGSSSVAGPGPHGSRGGLSEGGNLTER
ncbi:hypothetical protein [Parafrankia sp. EUN1f]|uniref:hypothetical protein n=1 Tax=Parafrankia sp. EUN1f TaxID=102897 RepID=UPI0001C43E7A|nr:hypothetical protein [Parafrankia sp. EUN1f]EFC84819.1 Membrane protein involved in the export of O-antigen and teichoic acid-like protein [Parafrankia sp. EUN1f]